jgi:FkbM family methyltransferase
MTKNKNMRQIIKKLLLFPLEILNLIASIYSYFIGIINIHLKHSWIESQIKKNNKRTQNVTHKINLDHKVTFDFFIPNWVCKYRADTFSSKEPETLKWIDDNGDDGVFFDIGANVGIYSIYYAKTKKNNVYAFEPSFFNLSLLSKNINKNGVQDNIKIITNPLSDNMKFADFNLTNIDEGGALSAFGVDFNQDGNKLEKLLSYKTLGLTLDFLLAQKIIPEVPKMIKIDVDGIEHLILLGAKMTLKNPICQTVLIEVNDKFKNQALEVKNILIESGFSLKKKYHAVGETYNQIWSKD